MKKIIVSTEQMECLLKGEQVPIDHIVVNAGEKYTLTDKSRELTATCIFYYDFTTWRKSIFVMDNTYK